MSDQPDQGPEAEIEIDRMLAAIDPEFDRSMAELGQIKNADVDLELSELDVAAHVDDDAPDLTARAPEGAGALTRLRFRLGNTLAFLIFGLRRTLEFVKFAVHAFKHATRTQKLMAVGMIALFGLALVILLANLRGRWLPTLDAPVIGRLEPFADHVVTVPAEDPRVSLAAAFPPDAHEFLFKPFKVNLRPTADNPQPMGAFEFVIAVDTEETATEARDREVELVDLVQRTFEEQTFHDLATEAGKTQLKDRLRRELNAKLGPKRVSAVNFKTFVLKP